MTISPQIKRDQFQIEVPIAFKIGSNNVDQSHPNEYGIPKSY